MTYGRKEHWKSVPGYKGYYEVSDKGRVRGLSRRVGNRWGSQTPRKGKLLSLCPDSHGYLYVRLSRKGQAKNRWVHQLVLQAFVGPCPKSLECCHNDGDLTNNRLNNLRYDTKRSNEDDKKKHGTEPVGERNPNSKLTSVDVRKIRRIYAKGNHSYQQLAKRFSVSPSTIGYIVKGKTWKEILGVVE